jgi:hypothetical protein
MSFFEVNTTYLTEFVMLIASDTEVNFQIITLNTKN